MIKAQKNAANMHNNMPTLGRLQNKFQEAKESGNTLEGKIRLTNRYYKFFKA